MSYFYLRTPQPSPETYSIEELKGIDSNVLFVFELQVTLRLVLIMIHV